MFKSALTSRKSYISYIKTLDSNHEKNLRHRKTLALQFMTTKYRRHNGRDLTEQSGVITGVPVEQLGVRLDVLDRDEVDVVTLLINVHVTSRHCALIQSQHIHTWRSALMHVASVGRCLRCRRSWLHTWTLTKECSPISARLVVPSSTTKAISTDIRSYTTVSLEQSQQTSEACLCLRSS